MSFKNLNLLSVLVIAFILSFTPFQVSAAPDGIELMEDVSGVILEGGPYYGNVSFSGNVTINGNDNTYAIKGYSGYTLTSELSSTITINMNPNIYTTGINTEALSGQTASGIVDFRNSTVKIFGNSGMGVIAGSSGKVYLGDNSIITFIGTESDGSALWATSNGFIKVGDGAELKSDIWGNGKATVHATYNGNIEIGDRATIINDGRIDERTHITHHFALYANGGSTITVGDESTIATIGNSNAGGMNHAIATNTLAGVVNNELTKITIGKNANISTVDYNSYAVYARNKATIEIGEEAFLKTSGQYAQGLLAATGSTITIGNGSYLETNGEQSFGSWAQDGSTINIGNGVTLKTTGYGSRGIYSYNENSITTVGDDLILSTKGAQSYGIYSQDKSTTIVGDNLILNTEGTQGYGIYSQSESSTTAGNNLKLDTSGDSAWGVLAFLGGKVILGNSASITTHGTSAYGLYVSGTNSEVTTGNGLKVTTYGENSHAIYWGNGGTFNIGDKANIVASGISADVFFFGTLQSSHSLTYKNANMTSKLSNLISSNSTTFINMTFEGESKLYGDLKGFSEDSDINLILKDTTTWEGGISASNLGTINVSMSKDNIWFVNKNSLLNSIKLDNGLISFRKYDIDGEYYIITAHTLEGSGKIDMNVNLSPVSPDGDFLDVGSAEGNYIIFVSHTNIGGAKELQLVNVANPDADLTFSLSNSKVQIGAYNYTLDSRSTDSASATEWYLKLSALDIHIKEETPDSVIGLGEFAKSIDATLSDEFLRTRNKLWVISFYKLQNFDEEVVDTSIKQQIGGGIIGLDQRISNNFSIGEFFGLGVAYQNIGEGSVGHIASLTIGTYANYTNGGFLASGYVRVADYIHDLRMQGSLGDFATGTMNTYGWSASLQVSQKISLLGSRLHLTPKAKATYTYVDESTYDVGGMIVRNLDITGLVTWVGARIGVEKSNDYEKPYGYYLEAGWIHDTNPSVTVMILDEEAESETMRLGNNRFEVGIGFYTSPLGASNFSAELKYSKGKGIEEPVKVTIGGSVYF